MTQLTETVRQNADNARQANTLASNATGIADAGNDAVQSMVETISKISTSSTQISDITGYECRVNNVPESALETTVNGALKVYQS